MAGTTGTAREEAERLVAAVLAMAGQSGLGGATRGRGDKDESSGTEGLGGLLSGVVGQFLGGAGRQHADSGKRGGWVSGGWASGGWATGSAECCVCPVCRAIANLRDPSPEQAERLATGAGDFASGVASLLRAFSAVTGTSGTSARPKPPPRQAPTPDQAWSAATRERTATPAERVPTQQDVRAGADPWSAATRSPRPAPEPPTAGQAAAAQAAAAQAAEEGAAAARAAADNATEFDAAADTAEPGTGDMDADVRASGDPWAAATRAPRQPTRPRLADAGGDGGRATRPADASGGSRGGFGDGGADTGVADGLGPDHDVPGPVAEAGGVPAGTAPAAPAAEDRDGGAGDDARPGDAV